jgi:hypothetical protein
LGVELVALGLPGSVEVAVLRFRCHPLSLPQPGG